MLIGPRRPPGCGDTGGRRRSPPHSFQPPEGSCLNCEVQKEKLRPPREEKAWGRLWKGGQGKGRLYSAHWTRSGLPGCVSRKGHVGEDRMAGVPETGEPTFSGLERFCFGGGASRAHGDRGDRTVATVQGSS